MKNLYFKLIILLLITIGLNSCTKNKIEGIELKENPYEEWSKTAPFDISISQNNCTVYLNWTMDTFYASKLPQDLTYTINVYKNGSLRANIPSNRTSFVDVTGCFTTYNYEISILYSDGYESVKSGPASIYTQ